MGRKGGSREIVSHNANTVDDCEIGKHVVWYLSRACLPVSEDCSIETFQNVCNDWLCDTAVHLVLCGIWVEHIVVQKLPLLSAGQGQ